MFSFWALFLKGSFLDSAMELKAASFSFNAVQAAFLKLR